MPHQPATRCANANMKFYISLAGLVQNEAGFVIQEAVDVPGGCRV